MPAHEHTAISTGLHPPKVWERIVDDIYFILKRTVLENFFHHINNFHQNILFILYGNGIMERSLYWYIGNLRILINTYTAALSTKQVARKVLCRPCSVERIPLSQIKIT